ACAPLWSQTCGTSVFSTGACTRLDGALRAVGTMAPTAQREWGRRGRGARGGRAGPSRVPCPLPGCSTYMDIVIVLDGSNSIYPWVEVQNFLSNILSRFFIGPGQIQVGVLQYGEHAVHEWELGRYRSAQEVVEAARNISRQEGRETRTAMAVRTACTEAFSAARGGRADATRLLIVVTDGESHDGEELPGALAECDRRNVTRYAIAVSSAARASVSPFPFVLCQRKAGVCPQCDAVSPVPRCWATTCAGSRTPRISSARSSSSPATPTRNISSTSRTRPRSTTSWTPWGTGSSAWKDGLLFGAVGAYDWEGAVLEQSGRGRIVPPRSQLRPHFPPRLKNHAAYLGYAVSSLRLPGGQRLLVAGAPRFQHKGKVILFQMASTGTVTVAQALTGEQIGSYFGSEVCPLDVDGDGVTDVLLVAAPMYLGAQSRETGRVYLYRRSGSPCPQRLLSPAGTLHPEPRPQDSRFGFAMAALPDLNHDGLGDAAVGAPLEGGHRGALYVFHGAPGTLLPQYKQ
ncbi:ITA10 protein, partial [Alopecoenas beccarii]|nr:ITA10 protein [Alopecoenas beccarii]